MKEERHGKKISTVFATRDAFLKYEFCKSMKEKIENRALAQNNAKYFDLVRLIPSTMALLYCIYTSIFVLIKSIKSIYFNLSVFSYSRSHVLWYLT